MKTLFTLFTLISMILCINQLGISQTNTAPYCEDFEAGNGGWIVNSHPFLSPSTWEYGIPSGTYISQSNSGSYCWVTNLDGDYNNDELSFITSPTIYINELLDPVLSFSSIFEMENGYDGVQVQISTDNGSYFSTLGSSLSPNWYNSSYVAAIGSFSSGNGNGFTGNNSGWTSYSHTLSAFTSYDSILVRFVFASGGNTVEEGFAFDDVKVAESNDLEMKSLIFTDSICGQANTEIKTVICNRGVNVKTGFDVLADTNGIAVTTNYTGNLLPCQCDTIPILNFNSESGINWELKVYTIDPTDVNHNNDTLTETIVYFQQPNVMISQIADILTSSVPGANYQWLDCDNSLTPISGEIGQNFSPSVNGSYAVIIDNGNCVDTSACFTLNNLGIATDGNTDLIEVYPNPTTGEIMIDLPSNDETTLILYNTLGEKLQTIKSKSQQLSLDIDEVPGVYFMEITNTNFKQTIRIIKQE